jgi:CheY-like chemotaxis protein/HPt (histidine-containing phosphotransfer) domain-containing protein
MEKAPSEDNATNQEVGLAQLRKLGYSADAVATGAAALEALGHGNYDLVLMDCQMPVMDGFEATRRIRGSAQRDIPVIALTAGAMEGDRSRCLSAGMSDYLSKPVEMGMLRHMLAKWLPESADAGDCPAPEPHARGQAKAVFNPEALLRRLMGDREVASVVLRGFLENAPSQLDNLRRRLDEADAPAARLQAHKLKGSAATVAAEGLHAIALAMERAGAAGQMDSCRGLLPGAVEEFERFKHAVERTGWV